MFPAPPRRRVARVPLPAWRALTSLSGALALVSAPLSARDYCFSPDGNDTTGDGTSAAPWATIAKANTLDLEPGDRLLFEGGRTFRLIDAASPSSDELVGNPGYENDLAGWQVSPAAAFSLVTTTPHGGTKALQVLGAADSYPVVSRSVPVDGLAAGDFLVLSGWARITAQNGVSATAACYAGVKANGGGGKLAETVCELVASNGKLRAGWTRFSCAIRLPAGFDYVETWFYQQGGMTVQLDDWSLRRVASTGGTLRLTAEDDGSVDAPLIVGSYGTGRATLDAGLLTAVQASIRNLVIRDLNLRGARGDDVRGQHGLVLQGRAGTRLENVKLLDLTVESFGASGVYVDDAPSPSRNEGFDDLLIERVNALNNRADGIQIDGTFENTSNVNGPYAHRRVTIRRCRALGNTGYEGNNRGSGILVQDADQALVEHCYASGNGAEFLNAGGGPVGIWGWDCDRLVIQWCESAGNISRGVDGGGFDLDGGCTRSVIQYCYSHDNQGPGYFHARFGSSAPNLDNVFRHSVSVNDATEGGAQGVINYWGSVVRCHTHNLVVIGGPKSTPLLKRESSSAGNQVFNNIFIAASGSGIAADSSSTGIVVRNNLFATLTGAAPVFRVGGTNYTGISAWQAAVATATGSASVAFNNLDAAPGLVGPVSSTAVWLDGDTDRIRELPAFRLARGSAAIDAGLDPQTITGLTNPATDLGANPAPQRGGWDIGAFERLSPDTFLLWKDEYAWPRAGVDDAPDADPDGDGLRNLLEYALGSPPLTADADRSAFLVSQLVSDPARLRLGFRRSRADLEYHVDASSDLAQWDEIAFNPGAVGAFVTVDDSGGGPKRFLRLRVVTP